MNSADVVLTLTTGNVTAVGGDWFLTDVNEGQVAGTLDLTLSDGTVVSNLASPASGTVNFRGFITDGVTKITSITHHPDAEYVTFDNLYVGVAVPEASTFEGTSGELMAC